MASGSSASSVCGDTLKHFIKQQWELAGQLLEKALQLKQEKHIPGMQRVVRKIRAERAFLESLCSGNVEVKDHHVSSSNLLHLEAVLHICEQASQVVAVQQSFCYIPSTGIHSHSILVDVVASEGGSWVKVFARNRHALHRKWLGDGSFGDKSVTDLANNFSEASKQNPRMFEPPQVMFAFFDGVTQSLAAELQTFGVVIVGPVFSDDSMEPAPTPLKVAAMFRQGGKAVQSVPLKLPTVKLPHCSTVNLDVSCMLAWVSSLTHGGAGSIFDDPILEEQAQQERSEPLWPKLEAATEGKALIACKTAVQNFNSILETVGGPEEKKRGRLLATLRVCVFKDLLATVKVVEDAPSERAMQLELGGKVKPRSKVIFGTGDALRVVTVTANEAFVRAATHQGVSFNVFLHSSRALTEQKQAINHKTRT